MQAPGTKGASLSRRIDAAADRTDWQDPTRRTMPSKAALDRMAERAITGGYDPARHGVCGCGLPLTPTGARTCWCE